VLQQLPVLIVTILSALAIIAVLIWRLRPAGDSSALAARLTEAEKRVLECERMASAKTAESEQLGIRLVAAETSFQQLRESLDASNSASHELGERAARAEQTAEEWKTRHADVSALLATAQAELKTTSQRLSSALAQQEADETAARRFEGIGQKVLTEALELAHKKIDELAKAMKEGSGEELGKHAQAVAKTLEPLQQKLEAYDKAVAELQKNSSEAYGGLKEQIQSLSEAERMLHEQAQALTTALSAKPKMRGMFGEAALKQTVEFAGMQEHCHFEIQASVDTAEGRKIPDVVVNLP
jgi:DNA recombination protein RmuC